MSEVEEQPRDGLWAPERRALTAGLVLTITLVASEALAVVTIMPTVSADLGGLRLYGWVFSAFMLGSLVGIVAAGRSADRRGPALPYLVGLMLFAAGLTIGGLAPTMIVLVAGRALQGIGAGAVPAVAYVAIGRSLPERLQPRMFAVLSTAWVLPGLVGPALSAAVARGVGWRWVFLGLLPLVAGAGPIALPALFRLGSPDTIPADEHRLIDGVRTAAGAGMVLGGLTDHRLWALALLVAGGVVVGVPALRRLLPEGTLRARRGLPATILSRGLLTFCFFGADAFVTLSLVDVRHRSGTFAGLAVTGATMGWTIGAWVQARLAGRWQGRRLVHVGVLVVMAGIAGLAIVVDPAVPAGLAVLAWTVGGLGMGMAYAPISLMMLREAPPGREGWASASLNMADVLGTALGTGAGGAALGWAQAGGWTLRSGVTAAFAIAAVGGVALVAISSRLPDYLVDTAPATLQVPLGP